MVKPTRVNYYVLVSGGLFFVIVGLYRVYEGVVPPSYYNSFDSTLALALGIGQVVFGLIWLYIAHRSGGHIAISGGHIAISGGQLSYKE